MVAASTGVGPGPARRTGLRPAAALPAAGRRPQSLGHRSGQDRASEGQDDTAVVRDRRHRGKGCGGDGHGHGRAIAGTPAQSRRGDDTCGESSERGDGVADAHAWFIGSPEVLRYSLGPCRGRR
jgi:hypothetical protein